MIGARHYAYTLFERGLALDTRWMPFTLQHPPLYYALLAGVARIRRLERSARRTMFLDARGDSIRHDVVG